MGKGSRGLRRKDRLGESHQLGKLAKPDHSYPTECKNRCIFGARIDLVEPIELTKYDLSPKRILAIVSTCQLKGLS